jgi:hypothetical protein
MGARGPGTRLVLFTTTSWLSNELPQPLCRADQRLSSLTRQVEPARIGQRYFYDNLKIH